jgi:hypothetical protein
MRLVHSCRVFWGSKNQKCPFGYLKPLKYAPKDSLIYRRNAFKFQSKRTTSIFPSSLVICLFAIVFLVSYAFFYENVLAVDYAYIGYSSLSLSLLQLIFILFFSLLPLFFYNSDIVTPNSFGVCILLLLYLPTPLTLAGVWTRDTLELMLLIFNLSIGMSFITLFSTKKTMMQGSALKLNFLKAQDRKKEVKQRVIFASLFISFFLSGMLIVYNYSSMKLVSLLDVYELRLDESINKNGILGYSEMWLSYCFYPFFLAISLTKDEISSRLKYLFLSFLLAGVCYLISGSKFLVFIPILASVCKLCFKFGIKFILLLLQLSSAWLIYMGMLSSNELLVQFLKSLTGTRVFGLFGWTLANYYNFFTENGYTLMTHVSIFKYMGMNYSINGESSLGKIIGSVISSDGVANFNANFFATDGVAGIGLWGIVPISLVVSVILRLANSFLSSFPIEFTSLWLIGFWICLVNSALSTSIFSGGLFIVLALARLNADRESVR